MPELWYALKCLRQSRTDVRPSQHSDVEPLPGRARHCFLAFYSIFMVSTFLYKIYKQPMFKQTCIILSL